MSVFPMMLAPRLTTFAAFHQRVAFQSVFHHSEVARPIAFMEEPSLIADSPLPASNHPTLGASQTSFRSLSLMDPPASAKLTLYPIARKIDLGEDQICNVFHRAILHSFYVERD